MSERTDECGSTVPLTARYRASAVPDPMRLERWAPGAAPGSVAYEGGAEILNLKGALPTLRAGRERGAHEAQRP